MTVEIIKNINYQVYVDDNEASGICMCVFSNYCIVNNSTIP